MQFDHLFAPLQLGTVRARNRVALVATLTNYAKDHLITPRWTSFLVERAKGGVGMLVTELLAVDPAALAHGGIVVAYDDRNRDGLERTAAGVREAGGVLIGQLWHPGRQQLWAPVRSPKGISQRPDAFSWTVPHVMPAAELRALGDRFVEAAIRLRRAGFSGVELHAAHGYLLTQLLSPWSNDRDDEYGGSVENRTRFVRDVARGIREACGADFVVGLKMPGDEGVTPGVDPEEAARIAIRIKSEGLLDYLAISQGNFSLSLENHVPDVHFDEAHFRGLARRLRPEVRPLPLMSIGRISTPSIAESLIAEGDCDLVGLSRALIADADWVRKAQAGRIDAIRQATYTNFSWGETQGGRPLMEENNPELAQTGESGWQAGRTERPRRVVVVGAGPAGLEAAWVLAARGHRVTVIGRSAEPGGGLRLLAGLPLQRHQREAVDWQFRQALHHGVAFRLGEWASVSSIGELDPDLVVLATGSRQAVPADLARGAQSLRDAVADGLAIERGSRVVLYDQDQTAATYAAADAIAAVAKLTLVTPRTEFAKGVNYCSQIGVFRRLYRAGVELVAATEVVGRPGGDVLVRNVYSGLESRIAGVAHLFWSGPRQVQDELARPLTAQGLKVDSIGDCVSPRNLLCAIHEGRALAMSY